MPGRTLSIVGIAFCAGALMTASLSSRAARTGATHASEEVGTAGRDARDERPPAGLPVPSGPRRDAPASGEAIAALASRALEVPIEDADVSRWKGAFYEERGGHRHEAVDILAPRNTPIHAVDAGVIAKLFSSKAGGLTVYQRDPTNRFIYYYAHLERYADVHEGQQVSRGDVLGYVGTSGNAPANTPHLHFAILELRDPARWWEGTPLDPYEVYEAQRPQH
ncbi:MAG: M23 family metallopeptidase [Bacteroidales bacterium]